MSSAFDFVKEQRTNYRSHTIEIADGYDYPPRLYGRAQPTEGISI